MVEPFPEKGGPSPLKNMKVEILKIPRDGKIYKTCKLKSNPPTSITFQHGMVLKVSPIEMRSDPKGINIRKLEKLETAKGGAGPKSFHIIH